MRRPSRLHWQKPALSGLEQLSALPASGCSLLPIPLFLISASTLQTAATESVLSGEHMKIAGIVLIIAGVVALVYGGFTYTTTKKAVDMGPIQINTKQNHSVPLPPVLGIIAIAGGGALLYFGAKKA
jgi:uncharacterized membrane protein YidH (DUF202 family)